MTVSLCRNCGSLVSIQETFDDYCPDCGQPGDWDDNPKHIAKSIESTCGQAALVGAEDEFLVYWLN